MTLRASLIAPITWTLLIPLVGWPTVMFACLPVLFFFDGDVLLQVSGALTMVWFVLMWAYFLTLRMVWENHRITVSSCLRRTSVVLDEETLIRHMAAHVVLEGVNVSAALELALGQEATTHMQITIRNGNRQVKVGSAFKGISALRDRIIAFEKETILPTTLKRLQLGEKVNLEPFEFWNDAVTYKQIRIGIPLENSPELSAGFLHFKFAGKKRKLPFKKIWNPITVLHLLGVGSH